MLTVGIALLVIFIILFIVFLVLWLQNRDKPKEISDQYTECNNALQPLQTQAANIEATYQQCESAIDQLESTLDTNFLVDTTNMDTPIFLRDHTTDRDGNPLTVCNYPTDVSRFVYDQSNFQSCGFQFGDQGRPRCSSKDPRTQGYGRCINTFADKNTPVLDGDTGIFQGYDESKTPCFYWKIVNQLDPKLYTISFGYYTDSTIIEPIYVGSDSVIDSTYTKDKRGGDSCIPPNAKIHFVLNGVKGSSVEKYSELFVFPSPHQDFVISTWFNDTLGRPSVSIGYVFGDTQSP